MNRIATLTDQELERVISRTIAAAGQWKNEDARKEFLSELYAEKRRRKKEQRGRG